MLLARANAPGVADKLTLVDGRSSLVVQRISSGMLMNTFPRAAPFEAKQNGHKLFWFTVASQRRAGLRVYKANGSYPGFFLPFQDLTTSNHMAAWTQKYVSDNPPPAPPTPPPAPPLTAVPQIPIL